MRRMGTLTCIGALLASGPLGGCVFGTSPSTCELCGGGGNVASSQSASARSAQAGTGGTNASSYSLSVNRGGSSSSSHGVSSVVDSGATIDDGSLDGATEAVDSGVAVTLDSGLDAEIDGGAAPDGSAASVDSGADAAIDSGPPPSCVPSANFSNPIAATCGTFVSNRIDGGAGLGTQASPYASVSTALAANATTIYVCAGSTPYSDSLTLDAGVTIYGGLDCSSWIYNATKPTRLTTASDTIPLTVTTSATNVSVFDFAITSADSLKPGGSSIAVLVDGTTASLIRCALIAGRASDGGAGSDNSGHRAVSGTAGHQGGNACSASTVSGAPAVSTSCGVSFSIGGKGGDGNPNYGGNGQPGLPGSGGDAGVSFGQAGNGDNGSVGWLCAVNGGNGGVGFPGGAGEPGAGAPIAAVGSLSANGFVGASGSDGQPGLPGQGGGGGGGELGGGAFCPADAGTNVGGASGGSGGSGGCGGLGGGGGRGAGASIALVSLNSSVTLSDVTFKTSDGATGGTGGNRQPGGLPGTGALGGMSAEGNPGCPGGSGGIGGNGGPGGGGRGGHSIGIAATGPAPFFQANQVAVGNAGSGGLGGNGNMNSNSGAPGIVAVCWRFDLGSGC